MGIDFVDERDGLKHHPLVRATRHIDSDLKELAKRVQHSKGRWHDMQMLRLQNPEPFLVAYRKGLDWRAYLDERCILAAAAADHDEEAAVAVYYAASGC